MRLLGRCRPVLFTPAAMLVVAACATSAADTPAPSTSAPTPQHVTVLAPPPDQVTNVVDARTVLLSNGVEARVLGLAAPGECYSAQALKFAQDTLLNKPVRYSRASESAITLRLANNDDYATLAVNKGALRAEKDDPVLTELEKDAENAGLGLWAPPCKGQDVAPTAPPLPVTTTTPQPAPPVEMRDCAVTYRVLKEWTGGFHVEIVVHNTTQAAVSRWSLRWKFSGGQKVGQAFNAMVQQYATDVIAMSANGPASLNAGASVTFRFNTTGSTVTPKSFALNGKSCSLS